MKKLLKIGIFTFLAGITLLVFSLFTFGSEAVESVFKNISYTKRWNKKFIFPYDFDSDSIIGKVDGNTVHNRFKIDGDELKVNANSYELIFIKSDDGEIHIDGDAYFYDDLERSKIEYENGELTVKAISDDKIIKGDFPELNIKIPETVKKIRLNGKNYEADFKNGIFNILELKGNYAAIDIEQVQVSELITDVDFGELKVENSNVEKSSLKLNKGKISINESKINDSNLGISMGEAELDDCEINNVEISVSMGKIDVNAVITGKNSFDTGTGDVDIEEKSRDKIDLKERSNIILSCGMGNIKYNGEKVKNDFKINSNSKTTVEVKVSAGNIEYSDGFNR